MLAHVAASGRLATISARPSSLALIRQASSSSGGNKKNEEPVAVSAPTASHGSSENSPMSQRPLPADDGKVRMYSLGISLVLLEAASSRCQVSPILGM